MKGPLLIILASLIPVSAQPSQSVTSMATVNVAAPANVSTGGVIPLVTSDGNQYLCEGNEVVALTADGHVRWRDTVSLIKSCDASLNGELVITAIDNYICYYSSDGTRLWRDALNGRAAYSSAVALGNGQAIAVIDMSLYGDPGPPPPDKIVHIKKALVPQGIQEVDSRDLGEVPNGARLYRNGSRVYAITPTVGGERKLFSIFY